MKKIIFIACVSFFLISLASVSQTVTIWSEDFSNVNFPPITGQGTPPITTWTAAGSHNGQYSANSKGTFVYLSELRGHSTTSGNQVNRDWLNLFKVAISITE